MIGRRHWVCLLLLITLLPGCWDRREIEERSSVLAAGVDLCAEEEGCAVVVSRQVAIPGRIPLGGGEGGRSADQDTVFVGNAPGGDVADTLSKAQAMINRKLSFGHLRLIVWSEEFARQGLTEYVDYLRRLPEVRRMMWLAVAEGRAEAVIRAHPALDRVPALFLNDMIDDAVKSGRLPQIFLGEFLTRISNAGEETVVPLIRMEGPDRPALSGLAVFRDYKMVGKLTPDETSTFMSLRGDHKASGQLEVGLPGGRSGVLGTSGQRSHYQLSWQGGRVHAHVKIEMEAELFQLDPNLDSSDPEVIRALESRAADEVEEQAGALIEKLQTEYGADVIGLGERIRALMPGVWNTIDSWPEAFARARFTFEVEVHIRRTGMATH